MEGFLTLQPKGPRGDSSRFTYAVLLGTTLWEYATAEDAAKQTSVK